MMTWHNYGHHTKDEIDFLSAFYLRNRAGFLLYAAVILEGRRVFDRTVDVGAVRRHVRGLMAGGVSFDVGERLEKLEERERLK